MNEQTKMLNDGVDRFLMYFVGRYGTAAREPAASEVLAVCAVMQTRALRQIADHLLHPPVVYEMAADPDPDAVPVTWIASEQRPDYAGCCARELERWPGNPSLVTRCVLSAGHVIDCVPGPRHAEDGSR